MKSILLVDDDRISNFLKQAIDLFNEYYIGAKPLPDVILLDLNMPIMEGFGFLEAFRSLDLPGKDRVKIIIVSSSVSPEDIARAKHSGASQYLSKPVNEQNLRRAFQMCKEEVR